MMLKQLWCRIVGTGCKWKIIDQYPFKHVKEVDYVTRTASGTQYTLQCEVCGRIYSKRDSE